MTTLDLIIRNAARDNSTVDIGVRGGVIVAIEPNLAAEAPEHDAAGKFVSPGLIESHFHLDKALIVDRVPLQPNRMVRDHMERTASVKHTFTLEDIYARAQATLEQCLLHGVTHMRTQIEVDPNVGLLGFEAIEQLRKDYAWAIDIQPCVFLQEGWTDVPGADENLVTCVKRGSPVIGGGIRYAMHSRFSGAGKHTSDGLNATPSLVAGVGYQLMPHLEFDARYVYERYEQPNGVDVEASHWGLGLTARY